MISYSKILLAGIISGFVALTTSFLGVTGTVIGTVIASIIYNFLSEHLENRIETTNITRFENELIFLLPLVIIAIIQFILIFAFLSEWGYIDYEFLNVYLSLQSLADNNLYRILGVSTILISVYPIFLKGERINRNQGILLAFVGIIFLFRGFSDFNHPFVDFYNVYFHFLDFYLAILTFAILVYLIVRLSLTAYNFKTLKVEKDSKEDKKSEESAINTSVDNIEFVSNEFLKYKKRK